MHHGKKQRKQLRQKWARARRGESPACLTGLGQRTTCSVCLNRAGRTRAKTLAKTLDARQQIKSARGRLIL
jgi:hypothetical protein